MTVLSEDYWNSLQGLSLRLQMLAENIAWHTFNEAIKLMSAAWSVDMWQVEGPLDEATCPVCEQYFEGGEGRILDETDLLPDFPLHIGCRHWLVPYIPTV